MVNETLLGFLRNAERVIAEWIDTAKGLGRAIPEPRGRLMFA